MGLEVEIDVPAGSDMDHVEQLVMKELVAQAGEHIIKRLKLGKVIENMAADLADEAKFGVGNKMAHLFEGDERLEHKVFRAFLDFVYEEAGVPR